MTKPPDEWGYTSESSLEGAPFLGGEPSGRDADPIGQWCEWKTIFIKIALKTNFPIVLIIDVWRISSDPFRI